MVGVFVIEKPRKGGGSRRGRGFPGGFCLERIGEFGGGGNFFFRGETSTK